MRVRLKFSRAWLVALTALAPLAGADEVFLVGGGRIVGDVVERRADAIVVEVGPGRVTLPASRVARITSGTSALSVYRERAARLDRRDVAGWLALGAWAQQNDLLTLAGEAFQHVATVDPGNEAANRALGNVRIGGQWMSEEAGYRARGYVNFEGRWMTPEEAQLVASQRAAENDARRADREAAAREREAEARVRIAEAEAERAAAEADAAASDGGIPYPWVFGPSYGPYGPPYGGVVVPHRSGHGRPGRGSQGHDGRRSQDRDGREARPPQRQNRPPAPAPPVAPPRSDRGRSSGTAGVRK